MARLGEALPEMLAARGIETAFALPGLPAIEAFRAIDGSGLRVVWARSAAGAGFMADGYARASGHPAAVIAVTGPGLTGLATAMGQALSDSAPMLVLTATNPPWITGAGTGAPHDLRDAGALAASVALWSRRVDKPEDLAPALDAAMAQFAAGRPGPVHIEIPKTVLAGPAPPTAPPAETPEPPGLTAAKAAEIVARLSMARRPLILAGGGAVSAADHVVALARRIEAPVLLTSGARGLLAPDDRLYAGGWLPTAPMRALLSRADAVLAIGTELAESDWSLDQPAPIGLALAEGVLIRIDIDPAQLERNAPASIAAAADAGRALETLLDNLPQRDAPAPDGAALRREAAAALPERFARHAPVIEAVWEHLPDAILVADVTEPARYGRIAAAPPAPRRWWTAECGFRALGYALPAAIGAKVAEPRRPVVALIGDGGIAGVVGELSAAFEAAAHVIVLVWNNSGYGETREQMRAAGVKPVGVDLAPVEFQPLARAFGAAHARVHNAGYLRDALKKAMMRPGPTILELREEYWFEA